MAVLLLNQLMAKARSRALPTCCWSQIRRRQYSPSLCSNSLQLDMFITLSKNIARHTSYELLFDRPSPSSISIRSMYEFASWPTRENGEKLSTEALATGSLLITSAGSVHRRTSASPAYSNSNFFSTTLLKHANLIRNTQAAALTIPLGIILVQFTPLGLTRLVLFPITCSYNRASGPHGDLWRSTCR